MTAVEPIVVVLMFDRSERGLRVVARLLIAMLQERLEVRNGVLPQRVRQDAALTNTFTNEGEIDLKRDRDLQVVDGQLVQMRVSHKNASDRHVEVKSRIDAASKSGKPASDAHKEDLARAETDVTKTEQGIAAKEKEKEEIRKRYADMKARYIALKGGPAPAPTAAAAPAAPAKK